VLFSSLILLLVIILRAHKNIIGEDGSVLNFIQHNLDEFPFIHVGQVDSDLPCPQGFEEISLFQWPGLKQACVCPDGSSNYSSTDCPDDCTLTQPSSELDISSATTPENISSSNAFYL